VDDANHLPIVIEQNGKRETVILEPTGTIEPSGHNPLSGMNKTGWIDMSKGESQPAWLRNQDRPYWFEFLPDSTLFVSYRAVASLPDLPNPAFWRRVFSQADSLPVKRMVIDVRENGGGESFFNRLVVRNIIARPQLDRPDRLFVITGGNTFSAAMNLVEDLEQWTNATFVGEPTGNALTFFGDHTQIVLPVSGITVNVSTLPWYPSNPRDKRNFIAPRLYVPMTSAEYRAGIDPAMRAIIARGSQPTLAQSVEAAMTRGDSAAALKLITDAANDRLNRFRSPEPDINALAYRLLPSNRSLALAVFRINTRAFPSSPNVWDSYGEALLADGQRDSALSAYRKAVSLSPGFPSSVQALRRLGVSG
jgi:hypothetical protein